jgi:AbrB family looped-hinge helix DNA binding protein
MNAAIKIDTVCFSTKGQVVIPRRLRKEFEIEAGTRASVQSTPQGILIKPLTARHIHSLRGSLKGSKSFAVFKSERKKEREGLGRKLQA